VSEEVPGTRELKKAQTRERLLKAARKVFTSRGFDQTQVGAICRAARVTHGALYHHFPGKTELFVAVLHQVGTEVVSQVEQAARKAKPGWPQVEAAADAFLDACLDPSVQAIYLRDGPHVLQSEAFRSLDQSVNEPVVVGLVDHWMKSGLLQKLPLLPTARVLGGAFAEAGMAIAEAEDPAAARRELGKVMRVVLEGLRAPP
jgi:AcrR family transcriptional regulator